MNNNEENEKENKIEKNEEFEKIKEAEIEKKENNTNKLIKGFKQELHVYKKSMNALIPASSNIAESLGVPPDATDFSNRLGINPDLLTDTLKPHIYIPQVLNIFPDYEEMSNAFKVDLSPFAEIIKQQYETLANNFASSLSEPLQQLTNLQKELADFINKQLNLIPPFLKDLSNALEEVKDNPASPATWRKYYNTLTKYFGIFPYKMTTEEFDELLKNISEEKEFDAYMRKYFNKKKVSELTNDIKSMLLRNDEKIFFDQIVFSYNNKKYAIANVGLTSIIDNALSFYLYNKVQTKRQNIFDPIIDDLDSKEENSQLLFIVMMINSNITRLYEFIDFNNKISITTKKKARRHPFAHGKLYSNRKTDTLMLLNTLYYILLVQQELKKYEGTLKYSRKKEIFYLSKSIKK